MFHWNERSGSGGYHESSRWILDERLCDPEECYDVMFMLVLWVAVLTRRCAAGFLMRSVTAVDTGWQQVDTNLGYLDGITIYLPFWIIVCIKSLVRHTFPAFMTVNFDLFIPHWVITQCDDHHWHHWQTQTVSWWEAPICIFCYYSRKNPIKWQKNPLRH